LIGKQAGAAIRAKFTGRRRDGDVIIDDFEVGTGRDIRTADNKPRNNLRTEAHEFEGVNGVD